MGDTIVVAFLDRFSRNFEEGVAIQADLTRRDIGIVAIREQIDTREGSAAANFFRRAMLARGPTRWSRPASAWGWPGPGPAVSASGDLRRWVRNRWTSAGAWPRNSDGNPDSPQVVVFLATIVYVTVGS